MLTTLASKDGIACRHGRDQGDAASRRPHRQAARLSVTHLGLPIFSRSLFSRSLNRDAGGRNLVLRRHHPTPLGRAATAAMKANESGVRDRDEGASRSSHLASAS
jgi:hypothetical protein